MSAEDRSLNRAEFFSDIGYTPHGGQWPAHLSEARFRVMACGTRWGKTTMAAHEALALALEPKERAFGWICSATYDLADKVWRELVYLLHTRMPEVILEHKEHEKLLRVLTLSGGSCEIRRKSADSPVSLLGEGLDWLVLDEAAQVKPDIWERYLLARLLDKRGRAILISTPKGKGWFHATWQHGQRQELGYESWNSPTSANPMISREELELRRRGTPDLVWRQEYEAQFIEGAGQVFRNVRELATGEWAAHDPANSYYAGLDLARTDDYTVLVVMDARRRVVLMDRFTRLDWSVQGMRLKAALERYDNPPVLVDSTGAGEPVLEQLLALGLEAKPYQFTNSSKKALVDNLALAIEQRGVTLPLAQLAPELIDELESFQYSITDSGNIRTGAPSGYHDDCVIALALACWEATNRHVYVEEEMEEYA